VPVVAFRFARSGGKNRGYAAADQKVKKVFLLRRTGLDGMARGFPVLRRRAVGGQHLEGSGAGQETVSNFITTTKCFCDFDGPGSPDGRQGLLSSRADQAVESADGGVQTLTSGDGTRRRFKG